MRTSPWILRLKTAIQAGTAPSPHYSVRHEDVYWKDRLVIPHDDTALVQRILHEFHATPLGGHAGFLRTFHRIATLFFWHRMRRDIRAFVRCCVICQQAKLSHLHPAGLLQPLPIPNRIWEDIAMDFIIGLPQVRNYSVILVVVDRLSKYGHFIPLPANFSSQTVAEAFLQQIIRLHGIPRTIVSDRDKSFTSGFWRHLMKLQGTTLCLSSAYHPQSDGQSEILNKCLEMYLRCFVHDYPRQWLKFLPWAEFWYNSAYHSTTGFTPFKVVYGRDPPPLLLASSLEDTPFDVHAQLQERD